MTRRELGSLPPDVQATAQRSDNGEVEWRLEHAAKAIDALAAGGHVVLGLDLREYDAHGRFLEVPWSVFDGNDPERARQVALAKIHAAAELDVRHGNTTVLVTWR